MLRPRRLLLLPLASALAACATHPAPLAAHDPRPAACVDDDGKGERALRLVQDACQALEAADEPRVSALFRFPVQAHVMTYERIGPNVHPLRELDRSFASARALIDAHPCPSILLPASAAPEDRSSYTPPVTTVEHGYRVRPSAADAVSFRVESDDRGCMTIRSFRSE